MEIPIRFRSEMLEFEGRAQLTDFSDGEVIDISQGGVFIRSEFFEIPGTPVHLVVRVPRSDETITMNGRVAWIAEAPPKGPGMGIRLHGTPLPLEVLDRIIT